MEYTKPPTSDMECPATRPHTNPTQSGTSTTTFLKRRHDDAFAEDRTEVEGISPLKKSGASAPEIETLPRLHRLQSSPIEARRTRRQASDSDRKRKTAGERALVRSFQQHSLLLATTLNNVKAKKNRPLAMALDPSNYNKPSDNLLALPLAQTSDRLDSSEVKESATPSPTDYAILENGQYQYNLASVAYELTDDVLAEEEAHMKWIAEVNRSVSADIEEWVHLNPRYLYMSAKGKEAKICELWCTKDDGFTEQWNKTSNNIPFDVEEDTMDGQVRMSIARAAHLNPLPSDVPEDEIEEFVERVQRRGFEYHRAYNRKFMYMWKENAEKMRRQAKYEEEEEKQQRGEWQVALGAPQEEQEIEEETGGLPVAPTEPVLGIDPLLFL